MARPMVEVRIDGLRELEQNLKFLREQFGVKTGGIIIRGLRVGARIVRDDARRRVLRVPPNLVPSGLKVNGKLLVRKGRKLTRRLRSLENLLRGNIVEHAIPTASRIAGGKPTVLVRVRNHGYTRRDGKIFFNRPGSSPGWWWWLEFGTSRMPARPYLRPAFESKKHEALHASIAHMRKEIDELFKQNLKRAA